MRICRFGLPLTLVLLAGLSARAQEFAVKTVAIDGPSIGRKSAYNIALPADYETSGDRRYPVLYLLHGLTSNYTAWGMMGAQKTLKGRDLIIVMADAGNSWYLNWAESGEGQKNAWEDFIVKDLISHVDANYRTIASREGRAINGLSMGGYGALTLGLRHPDLFCSIGSHSGALGFARQATDRLKAGRDQPVRKNQPSETPNPRIEIEGFRSQAERTLKGKIFAKVEDAEAADPFQLVLKVPRADLPHIYVDCGTEDGLIAVNREFARLLMENKIPLTFSESAGGHSAPYWSREIGTSVAVQYAVLQRNLAKLSEKAKVETR